MAFFWPQGRFFNPALVNKGGINGKGQAMVEFALVFPAILLLIMGIMEFSLLANAHSVVNYAAWTASRSAIVHNADNERMKRSAAIACIPISPRSSAILGLSGQLNLDFSFLNAADSGYTNVADILDRMAFSYFTTEVEPSEANAGAWTVTVHHLYPLKFPCISRLAKFVSGPDAPFIELFSPGSISVPESISDKADMLDNLTGGRFIVISKQCTMGN